MRILFEEQLIVDSSDAQLYRPFEARLWGALGFFFELRHPVPCGLHSICYRDPWSDLGPIFCWVDDVSDLTVIHGNSVSDLSASIL